VAWECAKKWLTVFNLGFLYGCHKKERKIKNGTSNALSLTNFILQFLAKFFGCTSKQEITKLMKDTFPSICFPSVPLHRISQTLDKLVERGFTKEQIRLAQISARCLHIKINCFFGCIVSFWIALFANIRICEKNELVRQWEVPQVCVVKMLYKLIRGLISVSNREWVTIAS